MRPKHSPWVRPCILNPWFARLATSKVWIWFAPPTATGCCFRNVPDGPRFCFLWRAKYCAGRRRKNARANRKSQTFRKGALEFSGNPCWKLAPEWSTRSLLLGNADLILLSEEPLPDHCRENVRTIHTMALRLNEIVQRLSSIENEMELSEGKSHLETPEMSMAESSKR